MSKWEKLNLNRTMPTKDDDISWKEEKDCHIKIEKTLEAIEQGRM